jgi:hypothetical protein
MLNIGQQPLVYDERRLIHYGLRLGVGLGGTAAVAFQHQGGIFRRERA